MEAANSGIWSAASALLGAAVFILIISAIARAHSRMWRRVSARYRMRRPTPAVASRLETIVVADRVASTPSRRVDGYRQYAGTTIGVTQAGLRLSLIPIPPLNIMAPPLFLPFDEMVLAPTSWALWPEPYALRMRELPDIDIILARETVRWLRSQVDVPPFA